MVTTTGVSDRYLTPSRPQGRPIGSTSGGKVDTMPDLRPLFLSPPAGGADKEKPMSKLEWKLLTKKRGSSTGQGIPPGKEELLWVTGTVTLIYGELDAVLVDTFLSEQHSKELLEWVVESGKNLT